MGPLKGLQIIEMAGIGPAPFCGMVLSDFGANVIRVDRVTSAGSVSRQEANNRGKKSIAVDLKTTKGIDVSTLRGPEDVFATHLIDFLITFHEEGDAILDM